MEAPVYIVGTAGHIDHGKTSLVRALTGVNLDTLPDEQRRGITIALGFTRLELPSGRAVAFVDVPGHERLVRTMIAGAAGVDAVVFCVSASEGVMPQTLEHLDILQLLGVRHGILALTMGDLVEEELAELAEEELRETVAGTFLEHAPAVLTSAETGMGLERLKELLDQLPVERRSETGPFRLPVDRSFVSRGFGSVITGTVLSGRIQDGDEVELLPSGERGRVRGIQVHGEKVGASAAGLRTALNIAGVEREDLPRGTVVCSPGAVPVTSIIDARYRHLASAPRLELGARVRLLVGTAEVMAVVDPLDADALEPGSSGYVQLRTAEPVACLPDDPFILRRESPVVTVGGGRVLDPWAPRVRRRDAEEAVALLARLEAGDKLAYLDRAGPGGLPVKEARPRVGEALEGAASLGERRLSPEGAQRLEALLVEAVGRWHRENPLDIGAPRRSVHRGALAALDGAAFAALVERVAAAGGILVEGPRVRLPDWEVTLTPDQQAAVDALTAKLTEADLDPPALKELLEKIPEGDALVALLVAREVLTRVGPRVFLTARLERLVADVRGLLKAQNQMSPGDFKDLTGLSRRGAIPLLEWLDAQGVTMRSGDVRIARVS
jgi:selenocysteine-specific elongation factor